jgi:hypothetical protein
LLCSFGVLLTGFLLIQRATAEPPATQPAAMQVDISKLLNARVVITEKNGTLQLSDHALDHGNSILITAAAARVSDAGNLNPLSDSGLFPATDTHPDVQLPYAAAGDGPQVWRSDAATEKLAIPVPPAHYDKMQLFFISANGSTPISVVLHYSDGSTDTRKTTVPDFYFLLKPADRGWFTLAEDFGKVDAKGKMTEVRHHFIDGFNVDPDAAKELTQIELTKEQSKTVLNLFGVAGAAGHNDKP